MTLPWLSLIVFFPLAAAVVTALLPQRAERLIRAWATAAALAEVAIAAPLWWKVQPHVEGWQFMERRVWLPAFGASYSLGVDGISMLLVLLTVVISALSVIGAYTAVAKRAREFYTCLLALEAGMLGTFLATDLLLFYVFWEAMLIPMYLLIGIWGGPRRIYAAIKFFLYTMAGSVLMLVAILWLYFLQKNMTGVPTFALEAFYLLPIAPATQFWLFLAFAIAFAIKVPMFPLHTWLPDAHVEAPTAGSVILAAILLKMGTYGFLRFALPLFPQASLQLMPWIALLAIVGIWYGALVAMVQPDLKKLVAYSSVSHLGFCMLGLFALNVHGSIQGMTGAYLQMLNHGISTGALFLLVGVVYERRHTRLISDFGGLWKVMPVYAGIFLVVMLSSVGLPGTNGFVGEFLVLLGAFRTDFWPGLGMARLGAALAAVGVILSAVYMLWMFQRVMFGPVTHAENEGLTDLSRRERIVFAPLLVLIFWIGFYPQPVIDRVQPALARTFELMLERASASRRLAEVVSPSPPPLAPAASAPSTVVAPVPAAPGSAPATPPSGAGR